MLLFAFLGFIVGMVVGFAGVGAGILMTPMLIFFGIEPVVAVGTDLAYAFVIKIVGTIIYKKRGNVDFKIASYLLIGSFPAVLLSFFIFKSVDKALINQYLSFFIGIVLVLSSLLSLRNRKVLFFKNYLILPIVGFIVAFLVNFTSIGSGVFALFFLVDVFGLNAKKAVGTTIFYSLILSFIAGLNHLALGNVNLSFLFPLIFSGVLGVYLGSLLNFRFSPEKLKYVINFVLFLMGLFMIVSYF